MISHRYHARNGGTGAIHCALRKYGEWSPACHVLLVAEDWSYLCEMEKRAITSFNTMVPFGYNIGSGGEGNIGAVRSEETRKRISVSKKGLKKGIAPRPAGWRHTEEAKAKIAAAGRGAVFTQERKAKIGLTKIGNQYGLGRVCSEETRAKIAAAQKGKARSDAHLQAIREGVRKREERRKLS